MDGSTRAFVVLILLIQTGVQSTVTSTPSNLLTPFDWSDAVDACRQDCPVLFHSCAERCSGQQKDTCTRTCVDRLLTCACDCKVLVPKHAPRALRGVTSTPSADGAEVLVTKHAPWALRGVSSTPSADGAEVLVPKHTPRALRGVTSTPSADGAEGLDCYNRFVKSADACDDCKTVPCKWSCISDALEYVCRCKVLMPTETPRSTRTPIPTTTADPVTPTDFRSCREACSRRYFHCGADRQCFDEFLFTGVCHCLSLLLDDGEGTGPPKTTCPFSRSASVLDMLSGYNHAVDASDQCVAECDGGEPCSKNCFLEFHGEACACGGATGIQQAYQANHAVIGSVLLAWVFSSR